MSQLCGRKFSLNLFTEEVCYLNLQNLWIFTCPNLLHSINLPFQSGYYVISKFLCQVLIIKKIKNQKSWFLTALLKTIIWSSRSRIIFTTYVWIPVAWNSKIVLAALLFASFRLIIWSEFNWVLMMLWFIHSFQLKNFNEKTIVYLVSWTKGINISDSFLNLFIFQLWEIYHFCLVSEDK